MSTRRRGFLAALGASAAGGLAGCTAFGADDDGDGPAIEGERLTLTTTTSTDDTGLLDELNAPFEDRYGVTVDTVAQGTGAALQTARNGDSDVVMVHARSLEDEFVREGQGVNRRDLMFNDFVVVGGSDDPAGVADAEDAADAFTRIADAEATFVSRGDNSGTHTKERELWEAAGLDPDAHGGWYDEAGQGMGEVLVQADQRGAYTLADRGTYISMRSDVGLEIVLQGPIGGGPDALANPYGIVVVNPAVHENVSYDLAMAYVGFVTGPEGQALIDDYRANGEQLFYSRALSEEPDFQQYVPEGWSASTGEDEDGGADGGDAEDGDTDEGGTDGG